MIDVPTDPEALMNEVQVSEFVCVTVRALQSWRLRGGGPPYSKLGKSVRYRRRDVVDWVDQHRQTSTSGGKPA